MLLSLYTEEEEDDDDVVNADKQSKHLGTSRSDPQLVWILSSSPSLPPCFILTFILLSSSKELVNLK